MDNKDRSAALATYIKANKAHYKYSTLAHVAGTSLSHFSRIINGKTKTPFSFKEVNALTAYLKPHGYTPPPAPKNIIGDAINEPEDYLSTGEQGEAPDGILKITT